MQFRKLALILLVASLCSGCTHRPKTPVRVFFAGSLIIPFEQLEKAYEAKHPEIDLQTEGHGSIQVIRHVTEIHDLIDVAVTADQALIPMLMYASTVPETGQPYARWNVEFATNRLALAYRADSRYASEVNADNWYQIIARPGVKVGVSDPRFDACGYRALMALQLAEGLYGERDLFENLITASFKPAIRVRLEDERLTIHVPEIVETKPDVNVVVRGYSIQLIQLMEAGNLDYAFEYESVIQQHGLRMLSLPAALNLGTESMADAYSKVQVKLDFQRFSTIKPVFQGETIRYAVTIPTNAPHAKEAEDFVAFLLGPEGQRILSNNQQPLVIPPRADRLQELPQSLQKLCVAVQ